MGLGKQKVLSENVSYDLVKKFFVDSGGVVLMKKYLELYAAMLGVQLRPLERDIVLMMMAKGNNWREVNKVVMARAGVNQQVMYNYRNRLVSAGLMQKTASKTWEVVEDLSMVGLGTKEFRFMINIKKREDVLQA